MDIPLFSEKKPSASPQETQLAAIAPGTAAQKPQQSLLGAKKESPEVLELKSKVNSQINSVTGRLRMVEGSLENLRNHIKLIDNSLVDKHKALVSEMRSIEEDVRHLKNDVNIARELDERIGKRLEALASKQEVKVLERYVDMIQPMRFATKTEVEAMIRKVLKEESLSIEKEVIE